MPRIVPISKALQEVKRVEDGGPTGAGQQMHVILFAPQDKAYPKGPWTEREVPALDIRKFLQKGYLKEMPKSGIGESFPIAPEPGETIEEAEARVAKLNAGSDFGDLSSKTKKALLHLGGSFGLMLDMGMTKDEMIIEIEGASA